MTLRQITPIALAFAAIGGAFGTRTIGAQQKDPATAAIFSFLVTGLGQVYAGQPVKGVAMFAVSVGGIAYAASPRVTKSTCGTITNTDPFGNPFPVSGCRTEPTSDKLVTGLAIAGATWIYSMIDAPFSARDYNRDHGLDPVVRTGSRGELQLGLARVF